MSIIYLIASFTLAGLLLANRNRKTNTILASAFIVVQWIFTIWGFLHKDETDCLFFKFDSLGLLLMSALSIVATIAFAHTYDYIYKKKDNASIRSKYYGAMTILTIALNMAYLSSHIAVTWIFVEITTLSASALIFHRRNAGSIEATWKYVFACSMSLVFVYIGILLLSIAMGEHNETEMYFSKLLAISKQLDPFWLKMSFIFIFAGYTAKLGLFPMFTAGIDAKDKAPTPAAAMLSSVVMNAGFVGVYRFYAVLTNTEIHKWVDNVILGTSIISIFVAAVYLLKVKNVKRLFAYSSVEHIGVAMLGLSAGGIGCFAALLHLILHTFAKSAVFFQIGHLYQVFGTKNLDGMGNYLHKTSTGAVFMILAFFCVTAMPPSGLFVSEFLVFKSLIDAEMWIPMAITMILLSVIVWSIARDIFKILFLPPVGAEIVGEISPIKPYETALEFVLIILVIWLGICPPSEFTQMLNEAASIAVHVQD